MEFPKIIKPFQSPADHIVSFDNRINNDYPSFAFQISF